MRILSVLLLTGCGLEPLNVSSYTVDTAALDSSSPYGGDTEITDSDADADTDADTDTDSDADADTDTDTDADSPPVIQGYTFSDDSGLLQLAFTAADPDNDLSGGSAVLTVSGQAYAFDIPGDLDSWQEGGTSRLSVDLGGCLPSSLDTVFRVEDRAGNSSNVVTQAYAPIDSGVQMDSSSADDLGDGMGLDVGSVGTAVTVCGHLYSVDSWDGDSDYVIFYAPSSRTYTFDLSWSESAADYDLFLFDLLWGVEQDYSDEANAGGPEVLNTYLLGGFEYYVQVVGWSGNPGDWSLTIR